MRHKTPSLATRWLAVSLLLAAASACSKNPRESLDGVVVDSAGEPVCNVRVFSSGATPQTIETRTDAAGRFHLGGFKTKSAAVFAEKTGYRFTGMWVRLASDDATVSEGSRCASGLLFRVFRTDESPAEPAVDGEAAPEVLSENDRRELGRRMIEKLWAAIDHKDETSQVIAMRTICAMADVDPRQAASWCNDATGGCGKFARSMVAMRIADDDLDEAFGMLDECGDAVTGYFVDLARRYEKSDPAKATRCIEELAVRARALDQPGRTLYLARAAELGFRLGSREAGEKLADEAAKMAEKLDVGEESSMAILNAVARGAAAVALAAHDMDRAERMLEPICDPNGLASRRSQLAVAVATTDLKRALAIVEQISTADVADGARMQIVRRVAASRPADAVRIAEAIGVALREAETEGCMSASVAVGRTKADQAVALAWIAAAVAPQEKRLACSLIDRAYDVLLTPDVLKAAASEPMLKAAYVAMLAKQIGYPDMESVVWRTLACLAPKSDNSDQRAAEECAEAGMAALLGLVDIRAAKVLLETLEERGGKAEADRRALAAWLVVDPKRGEAICDEMLEEVKNSVEENEVVRRAALYAMSDAICFFVAPLQEKVEQFYPEAQQSDE